MIFQDESIQPGEVCMSTMMDIRINDMVLSGLIPDDIAYGTASMIINRELAINGGYISKR